MNRRVTLLSAALTVALTASAIGAAISIAAMALPVFSGTATEGKGESGEGSIKIEGGATIKCASGTDAATFESGSRHLGFIDIHLILCAQGGEPCFSLGDSSGIILVTATWHLVLNARPVDFHYFTYLVRLLHIECPKAAIKLLLGEGDLAAIIAGLPEGKSFNLTFKTVSGEGKAQEYSEFENEAGTGIKTKFEFQQEGGKAKNAFVEGLHNTLKFESTTSIEN
jgi:hypothetical protein